MYGQYRAEHKQEAHTTAPSPGGLSAPWGPDTGRGHRRATWQCLMGTPGHTPRISALSPQGRPTPLLQAVGSPWTLSEHQPGTEAGVRG